MRSSLLFIKQNAKADQVFDEKSEHLVRFSIYIGNSNIAGNQKTRLTKNTSVSPADVLSSVNGPGSKSTLSLKEPVTRTL
jgi:hypothetical protein